MNHNKQTSGIEETEKPFSEVLRLFIGNPESLVGLILLVFILLMTFVGPLISPYEPFDIVGKPLTSPGKDGFVLGTDYLGRDILTGILYGGRATLAVALLAALCTLFIGITIGAFAGFYGGWIDNVLMRGTEFFQVMPRLVLAMVLIAFFKPSIYMIIVVIGVINWPGIARLTRGEFLRIRGMEFVLGARVVGSSNWYIIWRVILPSAFPTLIVRATLSIGVALLLEAGLSFLGLGDANVWSWGRMIGSNRDYILVAWWSVTFPGLVIFITVLSVCLIGDGLTYALNPKLRERSI